MTHLEQHDWHNGLCSHVCGGDCSMCLSSWCCGCFVFGRTTQLNAQFPSTDKSRLNLMDANCAVFFLTALFGFHWVPMMLKRQDFRDQHNIEGNCCSDCLVSACCTPCGLAQMQTEVTDRAETTQLVLGENQYQNPQQGMQYQSQVPPAYKNS